MATMLPRLNEYPYDSRKEHRRTSLGAEEQHTAYSTAVEKLVLPSVGATHVNRKKEAGQPSTARAVSRGEDNTNTQKVQPSTARGGRSNMPTKAVGKKKPKTKKAPQHPLSVGGDPFEKQRFVVQTDDPYAVTRMIINTTPVLTSPGRWLTMTSDHDGDENKKGRRERHNTLSSSPHRRQNHHLHHRPQQHNIEELDARDTVPPSVRDAIKAIRRPPLPLKPAHQNDHTLLSDYLQGAMEQRQQSVSARATQQHQHHFSSPLPLSSPTVQRLPKDSEEILQEFHFHSNMMEFYKATHVLTEHQL